MKRFGIVASFVTGCAVLLAAFGIGWANWGNLANRIGIVQALMGALVIVVVLLVVLGAISRGRERWTALALNAVLVLGGAALTIFSIGWLLAPAALVLLVFSVWRLVHRRTGQA